MPWSTVRQLLFALGALALVVVLAGGSYFLFFYHAPSCADGILNQGEEGIDCGGACAHLCTAPNISTLWARSVRVAPGVYHAVALIKNPDTAAAGVFPYKVSLFDVNNILIATREGEFSILPGEVAPLFEANVVTGERTPVRTFVDIGAGVFEKTERMASPVRALAFAIDEPGGRVTATVENRTPFPVRGVTVTTLLFDEGGVVTHASQTTIDQLGGRERRDIVFTWQEPFAVKPAQVDIIPRVAR